MKIVIVGNGMVGFKCCEKLTGRAPGRFQITVFGEETRPAYDRVHLSDYFSGKEEASLYLAPAEWYAGQGIQLHLGDPVCQINRQSKTVDSFKGKSVPYDLLILATGSAPFVPVIEGIEKKGVYLYRNLEDLDLIESRAAKSQKGAVIGGGLLGLEAAKALLDLGLREVSVIEYASRLMPRQLDEMGSQILMEKLKTLGLNILLGKNTVALEGDPGIRQLLFSDGTGLDTDLLVISAGIRPRDELAQMAGLETGTRGGIVVDENMQTSDPFIYAVGECALHKGMIYGLVAPGYDMAEAACCHILDQPKPFAGYDMSTRLKLIGVDVASFGDPFANGSQADVITIHHGPEGVYKRINISKDGKNLLGGILIGDASQYNLLVQTVRNKVILPAQPEDLILGDRGNAVSGGLGSLPDEALICSCESISKKSICDAVRFEKCENVESIKRCTKAGTGCGGCVPILKDLMTETLKAEGKYIRNRICEHFEYSRQELFDLVKLYQIKTCNEVLSRFGSQDGCEICKPVIASILASLWNEMPLRSGNGTAQDSNDRFLANIQKGGSYSVVPRIPGGEITPDKLVAIGLTAKKYNLYTKITGGQRIDLFGAHLHDLPLIWEDLIAAGFESGHAYGKALRTVKSCVGSTWCRFGLHDSVSFAIRIEERYRGLRAPHKIKSAVSGCIRECAEAQSKDFGLIATEKGWNLYVCGNGGSKPQHALLLATDLDEQTCIRYIDRFLMFYIQTADPLTRTATWLNKMEGGIDYLRNVVIRDSLGLAAQWEQEMDQHVASYQCEWKVAIETPEIRKRFTHFVNAPGEKDPTLDFEPMREQKKAREWK
ncbi:MAG TPA: nitrite reductase large subunit NirB [Saprospiraceae bacterium]|nr:nitrite reductase large subunit NirB [Saprospiraceae bacterium]HNT19200.1 nitrite reductase large subunit NirB [Saprospiraceae bacterium]